MTSQQPSFLAVANDCLWQGAANHKKRNGANTCLMRG